MAFRGSRGRGVAFRGSRGRGVTFKGSHQLSLPRQQHWTTGSLTRWWTGLMAYFVSMKEHITSTTSHQESESLMKYHSFLHFHLFLPLLFPPPPPPPSSSSNSSSSPSSSSPSSSSPSSSSPSSSSPSSSFPSFLPFHSRLAGSLWRPVQRDTSCLSRLGSC